MIYGGCRLFIEFNIVIKTQSTSLMGFDRISELKLQFIKMLSDSGLNSKEISDYLNSQSVRTPANKSYSSKLVWVS